MDRKSTNGKTGAHRARRGSLRQDGILPASRGLPAAKKGSGAGGQLRARATPATSLDEVRFAEEISRARPFWGRVAAVSGNARIAVPTLSYGDALAFREMLAVQMSAYAEWEATGFAEGTREHIASLRAQSWIAWVVWMHWQDRACTMFALVRP